MWVKRIREEWVKRIREEIVLEKWYEVGRFFGGLQCGFRIKIKNSHSNQDGK